MSPLPGGFSAFGARGTRAVRARFPSGSYVDPRLNARVDDDEDILRRMLYRWTHNTHADGHEWLLKRNCALRPNQFAGCFFSLAVVSLAIALTFASMGAWLVVPFTVIEISALAAAFVVFSRHATDYERIVVRPDEVVVEISLGQNMGRVAARTGWVRVEYSGRHGDLIRMVTPGQIMPFGRFVPSDTRARLAVEMRRVLATGWDGSLPGRESVAQGSVR